MPWRLPMRLRCGVALRTPPQLPLGDKGRGRLGHTRSGGRGQRDVFRHDGARRPAQAQSTAVGSSAEAQSTAQTSFYATVVRSVATAPTEGTAATNAIAQAGGAGQAFVNPGQTAYAFTVGDPDKAYTATLIGGEGNIADALLGPIFGAAILGAITLPAAARATFTPQLDDRFRLWRRSHARPDRRSAERLHWRGRLRIDRVHRLGRRDDDPEPDLLQPCGRRQLLRRSGYQSGLIYGPGVDLTFAYTLTADGPGGYGLDFVVGGAVPEPSTWAMTLVGFAGLGFAGYRARKRECKGQPLQSASILKSARQPNSPIALVVETSPLG